MAWEGFARLDGQEFINIARTEAYAEDQSWFRPGYDLPHFPAMLGEAAYVSPAMDPAPWYDPDEPESADFFGFYPLDVTGLDDSSRTSTVIESTIDGGIPGRLRHATKTVVFNGVIMASSEKGAEFGMRWLRRVLLGDLCLGDPLDHGIGTTLSFLASEPERDADSSTGPEAQLLALTRELRRFTVNSGPQVTSTRHLHTCEGVIWTVQFTGVAGNPYVFGQERALLQGYLRPVLVTNLYTSPSFETVEGWGAVSGSTEPVRSSARAYEGTWSLRAARGSGTGVAIAQHDITSLLDGAGDYWVTARVWVPAAITGDAGLRVNGTGVPEEETSYNTDRDEWSINTLQFTWDGVGTALLQVADVDITAGATIDVDTVMLNKGDEAIPYFSGATPDTVEYDYAWTGTANNSTSTRTLLTEPWVPGVTEGLYENDPTLFVEEPCGDDIWEPVYDPLCPAMVVPPTPPSIPLGCFSPPEEWDRRMVVLPAENVPVWTTMAPIVRLSTETEKRNVRVRFYEDPTESIDPYVTPCSYSEDIVFSYIPAGATIVMDAASREVWLETANGTRRRADSLLFSTEGRPFEWPELTCGWQYLMTVDVEVGTTPPAMDLSVVPKAV